MIYKILPENYFEHDFFDDMIKVIEKEKDCEAYNFYFTNNYKNLPEYGDKTIAILTAGDERGKPPSYSKNIKYIFKHHLDKEEIGNTIHLPLPVMKGYKPEQNNTWEQRDIDVFFSGHCLDASNKPISTRKNFIESVKKIEKELKNYNVEISLTKKWNTGFTISEYSKKMSKTKIILSPHGHHRSECIRFSEGVASGSAIISCEQPKTECYKNTPAFYVNNKKWDTSIHKIKEILDDKKKWQDINEKMKKCWSDMFCPEAQASKIIKRIKSNGNL
jgi:hypothetical protein